MIDHDVDGHSASFQQQGVSSAMSGAHISASSPAPASCAPGEDAEMCGHGVLRHAELSSDFPCRQPVRLVSYKQAERIEARILRERPERGNCQDAIHASSIVDISVMASPCVWSGSLAFYLRDSGSAGFLSRHHIRKREAGRQNQSKRGDESASDVGKRGRERQRPSVGRSTIESEPQRADAGGACVARLR